MMSWFHKLWIFYREADFQGYLPMSHLVLVNLPACFHYLKPSHIVYCLACPLERVIDGIFNSGRGCSHEFDQFVCVIFHKAAVPTRAQMGPPPEHLALSLPSLLKFFTGKQAVDQARKMQSANPPCNLRRWYRRLSDTHVDSSSMRPCLCGLEAFGFPGRRAAPGYCGALPAWQIKS